MENNIRAAFDAVRADDALVAGTMAFLRAQREGVQRETRGRAPLRRVVALAAALLLVLGGVWGWRLFFVADAYLSIDVNPSVALTLNRLDRVIGTQSFNEEGAALLGALGLRGRPYDKAAAMLLDAAAQGGYLADDALLSVTVQAGSAARETALCDSLLVVAGAQEQAGEGPAGVEVFAVSEAVRLDAYECHMSPARYLAIQELMEVDEEATLEAYSHHSIPAIRQRAEACRAGHAHAAQATQEEADSGQGGAHGQGRGQGQNESQSGAQSQSRDPGRHHGEGQGEDRGAQGAHGNRRGKDG